VLVVLGLLLVVAGVLAVVKLPAALALRKDIRAARRLTAEGKFAEARGPLERWHKAQPDSGEAFFLFARGTLHFQMFDQGLKLLARAEALGYPYEPIALERASALMRVGRHDEAAPILSRLVFSPASRPDPAADKALAKCYLETFQLGAATAVIERWIHDAPRDPTPYLWKARVDRQTSADMATLTADYEKALVVDPRCAEALLNLGEMYLSAHRLGDAEARYTAYLAQFPNDAHAHLGLGKTLAERGDLAAATAHLDRASALDPRDSAPLLEKARIEFRAGRLEGAVGLVDRALGLEAKAGARESDAIELHYLRGLVLARLGRKEEAAAEQKLIAGLRRDQQELSRLLEALQIAPGDVAHQYNAARWLIEHGHTDEGLRWAEKILREQPFHPETNRLLADYHEKRGEAGLAHFYRLQAGRSHPSVHENP
jgi:tetratricopeptide (TPR) repeat protein